MDKRENRVKPQKPNGLMSRWNPNATKFPHYHRSTPSFTSSYKSFESGSKGRNCFKNGSSRRYLLMWWTKEPFSDWFMVWRVVVLALRNEDECLRPPDLSAALSRRFRYICTFFVSNPRATLHITHRTYKNDHQTDLEKRLEVKIIACMIRTQIPQDFSDFFLLKCRTKWLHLDQHRSKIPWCNLTALILQRQKLTQNPKSLYIQIKRASSRLHLEKKKTLKERGLTLELRLRSSTCVSWLCSHGSETITPTKPDISPVTIHGGR